MNAPSSSSSSAPPLSVKNLSFRYAGQNQDAFENISLSINSGAITGILGPNGAGKSTLLKSALGILPAQGNVAFWGQTLKSQRCRIAYIPQRSSVDWDFPVSVLDVCLMGMYPRIGWMRRITKSHKEEAMSYLEQLQLQDLSRRQIGALSGGQQQRVFMARALAQKAELFLLDEPMAGIDQKTQSLLFELFSKLKKDGKSILIVHHNLLAAAEHFDDVILMDRILIAKGSAKNVLTKDIINKTYGVVAV